MMDSEAHHPCSCLQVPNTDGVEAKRVLVDVPDLPSCETGVPVLVLDHWCPPRTIGEVYSASSSAVKDDAYPVLPRTQAC